LIIGSSGGDQLAECKWFKSAWIKKMIHAEIGYTTASKRDNLETVIMLKHVKHSRGEDIILYACLPSFLVRQSYPIHVGGKARTAAKYSHSLSHMHVTT